MLRTSIIVGCFLISAGLLGCENNSVQNKPVEFAAACDFSGGTAVDGRCVCNEVTCDEGILCHTTTFECANKVSGEPQNCEPQQEKNCETKPEPISGEAALSLWTANSVPKKALIDYIETISKPGDDFIPVKDRIAVFDLDGTLVCETDPNYLDYNVYVQRVLEDPDYKDRATEQQIAVANEILEVNKTGVVPSGLDVRHQVAYMEAFGGMTLAEYDKYIRDFLDQPAPGYNGMKRGEAFYKPMLEVIKYLQAYDFTVYIVSGTDRLQVRTAIAGMIDIPERQVIGSDGTIVASGQEKTDDLNADNLSYVYKPDDTLMRGGAFIVKNLKMNKVAVIAQEIGRQPVLSFGNSSGDASMAEYVISNNPYKSLAFMLLADDLVRENGNQKKADSMKASCEKNGWIAVSMKDDWTTIYGDGVTRK